MRCLHRRDEFTRVRYRLRRLVIELDHLAHLLVEPDTEPVPQGLPSLVQLRSDHAPLPAATLIAKGGH
jgi:hypothetical protein